MLVVFWIFAEVRRYLLLYFHIIIIANEEEREKRRQMDSKLCEEYLWRCVFVREATNWAAFVGPTLLFFFPFLQNIYQLCLSFTQFFLLFFFSYKLINDEFYFLSFIDTVL